MLVVVIGYISLLTNARTKYHATQISQATVLAVANATEMAFTLQAIQGEAQRIIIEERSVLSKAESLSEAAGEAKEARGSIEKEIENFEKLLVLSRKNTETGIQIAEENGVEAEVSAEADQLETIKNLKAKFFLHKKLISQYLILSEINPSKAEEFLQTTLQLSYKNNLLPLIKKYEADAERELTLEATAIGEDINTANRVVLGSTLVALLTAILLGSLISRSISTPINNLQDAVKKISRGKLDTKVNIQSQDEVGVLAKAFNQMVEGLSTTTVSKSYLDNILSSMVDPLIVINFDTTITKVNPATLKLLGYAESELIDKPIDVLFAEDIDPGISRLVQNEFVGNVELSCLTKDGNQIPVSFSASLMRDEAGNIQGIVCVARDITERRHAEAQLRHDALHDALTGLPNRTLFTDRLEHVIELAKRRQDYLFAVLFLDLDRFKMINDSLGHLIGDQLLVAIAHRLETCMRSGDTVARLGGDEFTVLLEDTRDISDITDITERIQQSLKLPFNLNGHEVFTTASIGIVASTTSYSQPEDLMRDADIAMYHAKALGKARHEMFHPGMHDQAVAQLQLDNDLRRAIERQEFQNYYQPIVSLVETGRIVGFEALVRWQHPRRGVIPPTEFIPRAEETGLIIPLGEWVLREACRQMRAWQAQFPRPTEGGYLAPLTISVNLSGKQFSQPNLLEQIKQILQETGLDARSLKLEITESTIMENAESATAMLLEMQALGIGLSIDDFGTGYSSLGYLNRFPVDTLKIDRSFVMDVDADAEKIEIIRTVVMLARNLGMNVVAEGVETIKELT